MTAAELLDDDLLAEPGTGVVVKRRHVNERTFRQGRRYCRICGIWVATLRTGADGFTSFEPRLNYGPDQTEYRCDKHVRTAVAS